MDSHRSPNFRFHQGRRKSAYRKLVRWPSRGGKPTIRAATVRAPWTQVGKCPCAVRHPKAASRFEADIVVHRFLQALLAAEVLFSRFH